MSSTPTTALGHHLLSLSPHNVDEFTAPSRQLIERHPQHLQRQLIGVLVILRRRLDVAHRLTTDHRLAFRSLKLVQKRHRLNEREKAFMIAPGPKITVWKGQLFRETGSPPAHFRGAAGRYGDGASKRLDPPRAPDRPRIGPGADGRESVASAPRSHRAESQNSGSCSPGSGNSRSSSPDTR